MQTVFHGVNVGAEDVRREMQAFNAKYPDTNNYESWLESSKYKDIPKRQDALSAPDQALANPYIRRWDPRVKETYYEHRAIAEWKLGRPLHPGEVVHHDNGDKRDNHPDNIFIFSSQRAHMLFENYRLRESLGLKHLFTLEELFAFEGLWVVR